MSELFFLLPEVFLMVTLAGIVAGEITYRGEKIRLTEGIAFFGLASALIQSVYLLQYPSMEVFSKAFVIDHFSLLFKMFFMVLGALVVILSMYSRETMEKRQTEFYVFLVGSVLAMSIAASAADVLVVFLSFQLMNVLAYFMVGYSKHDVRSTEAAVKYLMFSIVATVFFSLFSCDLVWINPDV